MDAFLSPISRIVRATPVASFIMLLFLFLTKEHIPIVTSFLMVMPVVWSNVYEGITGTDVKLLEMARVFRLSFSDTLRHVYLPGIMPFFMAAAKAGMGLAWKAGTWSRAWRDCPKASSAWPWSNPRRRSSKRLTGGIKLKTSRLKPCK